LTQPGFRPKDVLPQSPLLAQSYLNYDEQIDFAIRQECCVKRIVLHKGYECRTPFLDPDWVSFILSVPHRYRENQYLYREILKRAYPKLYSIPTKTNLGLTLTASKRRVQIRRLSLRARSYARRYLPGVSWSVHPMTNYIDFERGLREREDLKTVIYENIQDLKRRTIVDWIDIDDLWNRHQRRQANCAEALKLLASLEINLKVSERSSAYVPEAMKAA
jgi:hypothetical protein